ncbi:polysaccharide pyruvyl transferase family protein [Marinilabiliaceae bacterium JC017]|nr:polysaccharide pyruvyl transferase family protein [Marinilabiliaceae bacterium JC017]
MGIRVITGGNFVNYGARSMLFCVADALKKKYPSDTIVLTDLFPTQSKEQKSQYRFDIYNMHVRTLYRIAFPVLKLFFKPSEKSDNEKDIIACFNNATAFYDISGYGISSHNQALIWTIATLIPIRMAQKNNIPYYILPQSIGPFNFNGLKKILLYPFIKKHLKYPEYIFTREPEGSQYLSAFRNKNVINSPDIVLQWPAKEYNNVFTKDFTPLAMPTVKTPAVGIIPNKQLLNFLDEAATIAFFKTITNYFITRNFQVYIFKHSADDKELCRKISAEFEGHPQVSVILEDYLPHEIFAYFQQFNAVVSARYHGLIHALKCNTPIFSLGWAVKYKHLMSLYNMEEYHLSVEETINASSIQEKLSNFLNNIDSLPDKIKVKNQEIINNSIFNKYL